MKHRAEFSVSVEWWGDVSEIEGITGAVADALARTTDGFSVQDQVEVL